MKAFMREFKEFINRGNVMDMAVGIIIGGAFTAIVNSLVDDIINPLIGSIFKMDFTALVVNVNGAELKYGSFIMAIINFLILAIVLFCIIKSINKMSKIGKKEEEEEEAPTTKICPFCKSEVPIDATKCCHCTSDLPEEVEEAE